VLLSAGAIASFAGTTRDHFEGKHVSFDQLSSSTNCFSVPQVVKLEYEAYEAFAKKELQ
jgi:molybdopterin synthase catalytic subunit